MYKPQIFLLWYLKVDIKFLSNLQKMYGLGMQLLSLKYYGLQYFWKINFKYSFTTCANRLHKHVLWHAYAFIDFLLWMSILKKKHLWNNLQSAFGEELVLKQYARRKEDGKWINRLFMSIFSQSSLRSLQMS